MFNTVQVRWLDTDDVTRETRVLPGTPESASEYVRRTYGDKVVQIVSAVVEPPSKRRICRECGQTVV